MRDDKYCGFLCSDVIERQEAIIKDIEDLSEYNKEFAITMFNRIIQKIVNAEVELLKVTPLPN